MQSLYLNGTHLSINYRMSGLIYSEISRGLEMDVSSKITLRPDSSADGLDRALRSMNISDNQSLCPQLSKKAGLVIKQIICY